MAVTTTKHTRPIRIAPEPSRDADLRAILYFTWFELKKATTGSSLGMLWAVLSPLIQMSIYVFVFAVILNIRYPAADGTTGGRLDYTIYILAGLVPWIFLSTAITGGVNMIQKYSGFIRQPNFPYRILPTVNMLLTFPGHVASVLFLLTLFALTGRLGTIQPHLLALVYVFTFIFLRGLATLLGFISYHLPDLRNVVPLLLTFLIYLSPIFYKPEQVPSVAQPLMYVNPLNYYMSSFKYALTGDSSMTLISFPVDLCVLAFLAFVFFRVEAWVLQRIRMGGIDSVI
jgi:lipopolysaccharide transport system permease protein